MSQGRWNWTNDYPLAKRIDARLEDQDRSSTPDEFYPTFTRPDLLDLWPGESILSEWNVGEIRGQYQFFIESPQLSHFTTGPSYLVLTTHRLAFCAPAPVEPERVNSLGSAIVSDFLVNAALKHAARREAKYAYTVGQVRWDWPYMLGVLDDAGGGAHVALLSIEPRWTDRPVRIYPPTRQDARDIASEVFEAICRYRLDLDWLSDAHKSALPPLETEPNERGAYPVLKGFTLIGVPGDPNGDDAKTALKERTNWPNRPFGVPGAPRLYVQSQVIPGPKLLELAALAFDGQKKSRFRRGSLAKIETTSERELGFFFTVRALDGTPMLNGHAACMKPLENSSSGHLMIAPTDGVVDQAMISLVDVGKPKVRGIGHYEQALENVKLRVLDVDPQAKVSIEDVWGSLMP